VSVTRHLSKNPVSIPDKAKKHASVPSVRFLGATQSLVSGYLSNLARDKVAGE
jgi:hypothetical protein